MLQPREMLYSLGIRAMPGVACSPSFRASLPLVEPSSSRTARAARCNRGACSRKPRDRTLVRSWMN
jgi:hypothetical protein